MKRRGPLAVLLGVSLLLSASLGARPAAKPLTPQNRLAIVRALAYEYATLRQPLPASLKEEEALEVDATGKVNEEKLRHQLANRGAATHTGEVVEITGLTFKPASILLEINGGGKKKRKWYQRIHLEGSGPAGGGGRVEKTPEPAPEGPPPRIGSWVLLQFPEGVPDIPPEEVKRLLAGVFDFSRRSPTVPWIETLPEEFRQAIKEKKAKVGMNREMVLAALGRPQNKVRETKDGRETEDWIYGNPPFVTFVTFVEDEVVEVKEFK